MEDWAWWLIAAVGLGIPLIVTALPEFAMFAVGALAGALTAVLGGGAILQVIVFAAVSVAGVVVIRPIAYRHRHKPQPAALRSGVDALKGRSATVVERVDTEGGRIKLGGEVWSARALEPDRAFEPGQKVDVVEIDGATAVVI
ncbi:hypothetical protein BIV57_03310 [Mangrovactinospora gilvigrisea]|uniref:NfeD-like C-terminal domain-containing protein n=1 Tax=Mangrovactinospora gilvigrisea TaxID=1428644 RepID=A0A1J7CBL2_9ACTN|nr:NfeD family protein [Mangrovactinospora gilvigrisea]OIV38908.1 hypothetical protein BIV57_03310 [Mangrovactinospora gilvigrisea]